MNQRLLERLKRHGDFPQLRPTLSAPRQPGSVEPFNAAQPRLVLSKQRGANAQSPSGSQPLEPALPTSSTIFSEADFLQAIQVESLVNATQVDSIALEDDAAFDGSNFSEIPFIDSPFVLDPQTVPVNSVSANTTPINAAPINTAPINTEATIATPLSTAPGAATNLAPNANPTANASANSTAVSTVNQLEPASRNPQRIAEPRASQEVVAQPIAATAPNALEPKTGVPAVGADPVSANTGTSAESRATESSAAEPQPQESAVFVESDANVSASSPSTSSNTFSTASTSQIDSEQSAPDFDRRAAMLELRELGVKVRVTLSNAALQAQLETVRTPAPSAAATRPASIPAPDRELSPATLEARAVSSAETTSKSNAPQAQPNPSIEDAARAPSVSSSLPDRASMGANPAEAAGLESASPESGSPESTSLELASPAQTLGAVQSRAESLDESSASSSNTQRTGFDGSPQLGVNQPLEQIAESDAEPAGYGTVVAVEVYNPPNRRVTVARPKATEAPMNQAEVLFSTLPDSSPLEWLNRLNSVQALGGDSSNAVDLASQVRSSPTQSSPALAGTTQSPAQLGELASTTQINAAQLNTAQLNAAPVSAVRTNAALLPNLETGVSPSASRLEVVRSPTPAAPLSATERGSRPSPALIAPVAGSAQSAAVTPPTPTANQRQAVSDGDANASQTSNQDATATATAIAREPALGNSVFGDAASEQTLGQATDPEAQDFRAQDLRAQDLEVTDVETGIGPERATSAKLEADGFESTALDSTALETAETAAARTDTSTESSPLEGGAVVQNGLRQSIPRATTRDAAGDSSDPDSEVTPKPSATPRDPSTSSQAASSQVIPGQATSSQIIPSDQPSSAISSSLADRGTDAIAPAATVEKLNAAARSDSAPQNMPQQGMIAGVEVYNPPNRRAAVARPKATEAPMNQAEVLFSTLPDSSPLEWLNRLNSVQALGGDSSNAPMLAPRASPSAADAFQAAPLTASEPGLRAAPNLSTARVVSAAPAMQSAAAPANTTSLTQSTARVAPEPGVRAAASTDLQRGSTPQMRAPDASNALPNAQPLVQIGGAQASASLIATPPSAAPLIAEPPTNPEFGAESPSAARAAEQPVQPVQLEQPGQPGQPVQPVRLSSSAQRLIAPITGIDPNTVQIRRDAQSDALTKLYRADALNVNGAVLLSARLGAETPEMLGVIAHELTHVARERQPRFVPPALRQPLRAASPSFGSPSFESPSLGSSSSEGQDEESIALQVEGFARALAQQGMAVSNAPVSSARPANGASVSAAGAPGKSRNLESVPWGDGVLPAPWELADRLEALTNPGLAAARRQTAQPAFQPPTAQQPLSQQLAAPQSPYNSAFTRSDAPTFAGSSSNSAVTAAPSSGGNFSGIGRSNAPVSVQAADQGRSVPTPSPAGPLPKSPEAAPKPASGSAPAPDLDDLARQVYAVLKRRLITERRRSS